MDLGGHDYWDIIVGSMYIKVNLGCMDTYGHNYVGYLPIDTCDCCIRYYNFQCQQGSGGRDISERRGLRGNWNEISKAEDLTTVDMRLRAHGGDLLIFFFREAKDLSLYILLPVCKCWKFILIKTNNKTVPICGPKKTCP